MPLSRANANPDKTSAWTAKATGLRKSTTGTYGKPEFRSQTVISHVSIVGLHDMQSAAHLPGIKSECCGAVALLSTPRRESGVGAQPRAAPASSSATSSASTPPRDESFRARAAPRSAPRSKGRATRSSIIPNKSSSTCKRSLLLMPHLSSATRSFVAVCCFRNFMTAHVKLSIASSRMTIMPR